MSEPLLTLLVGFMSCAWLAQSLAIGYVIYRYVYTPWRVVRRDQQAIGAKFLDYDKQLAELNGALRAKRLIDAMTDEELAQAELKAQSRSHARTR